MLPRLTPSGGHAQSATRLTVGREDPRDAMQQCWPHPFRPMNDLLTHRRGRPSLETGHHRTGATAAPTACQVDCVADGDILYAAEGMYSQDTLRATNLSSGRSIARAPYINID
jgi:hypothetical protein